MQTAFTVSDCTAQPAPHSLQTTFTVSDCTAQPALHSLHSHCVADTHTHTHCTAQPALHSCPPAPAPQNAENLRARVQQQQQQQRACVRAGGSHTHTHTHTHTNTHTHTQTHITHSTAHMHTHTHICSGAGSTGLCRNADQSGCCCGHLWEINSYFTEASRLLCLYHGLLVSDCTRGRTCTGNYQQSAQPVVCFSGVSVTVIIDKCTHTHTHYVSHA